MIPKHYLISEWSLTMIYLLTTKSQNLSSWGLDFMTCPETDLVLLAKFLKLFIQHLHFTESKTLNEH
ncbi:hypothetical protein BYT27DRAFT_7198509 [Phlegmacium glaucopus]|nr:hypothetical protein BYT27DRAFT_7198509 [Phlegmacium glaucopus]